MPVVRIWHGRTPQAKADAYWQFLHERAVPDYRSTPGNLEVKLLRRMDGAVCHFQTVTTWESMDAIIRFAGNPPDKAKYYAEDRQFLLEFEETVQHFEASEFRSHPA